MFEHYIKQVPFHIIPIGTIFNYYNLITGTLVHPLALKIERQFDKFNKGIVINATPTEESFDKNNIGGYFFYDSDLVQPIQCRYIII